MRSALLVAAFAAATPGFAERPAGAAGAGWLPPNEMVSWMGPADVSVSLRVTNQRLTFEEPPSAWDGAHLGVRYQDDCRGYWISLNRRDGLAVIKKKAPDGLSACGAYTNLGEYAVFPVPYGQSQSFTVVVRDEADGSVSIKLYSFGKLIISGRDDGVGGPPIREPGEIVLRSDNADLEYEDVQVDPLPPAPARRTFVSK